MKELIEKLNNLKILQTTYEFEELIPKEIWDDYFEGKYEAVDWNLDVDTHRWYETSITVLKFNDGFMGVRFITNMFSESQAYEDCYHHLEFIEMEEYSTVSYHAKKIKTDDLRRSTTKSINSKMEINTLSSRRRMLV